MQKKGAFITIYGINNIGKSTQAKLLVEKLKKAGYKAKYIKYPIYNLKPTGPFLNRALRNSNIQKISESELQLWFILNRYQFQPKLKRLLEAGYIIITEDYTLTGIAWGMAKGLDQRWLEEANKYLLRENFSILLEGRRSAHSREKKHLHESNDGLVAKCEEVFSCLAREYQLVRVKRKEEKEQTSMEIFRIVSIYLRKRLVD